MTDNHVPATAIRVLVLCLLMLQLACSADSQRDAVASRTFEMPETGRLTIEAADLEDVTQVVLILPISDEGPADVARETLIANLGGERLDTKAEPIPERPGRFRVSLSREQLGQGLSMIEVATISNHPLGLRRFVLDVKNGPNQGLER